jgi:hypothetical protein
MCAINLYTGMTKRWELSDIRAHMYAASGVWLAARTSRDELAPARRDSSVSVNDAQKSGHAQ